VLADHKGQLAVKALPAAFLHQAVGAVLTLFIHSLLLLLLI
jgi:hypothetical protein